MTEDRIVRVVREFLLKGRKSPGRPPSSGMALSLFLSFCGLRRKNMAGVSVTSFSKEEFRNVIDSFDTVLTDCDGMYNIILYIFILMNCQKGRGRCLKTVPLI
jgi:hypothetical protein